MKEMSWVFALFLVFSIWDPWNPKRGALVRGAKDGRSLGGTWSFSLQQQACLVATSPFNCKLCIQQAGHSFWLFESITTKQSILSAIVACFTNDTNLNVRYGTCRDNLNATAATTTTPAKDAVNFSLCVGRINAQTITG
ncbi:unnamed protein product [Darwinula stevensoni]|uniref:Uncharacterized protein n=1 Tax=Darwinula stevensoni TaxID=69355 RepID=A0A7R9FTH3_9CRUS|nr:unnamed protein product [Darwinula stevensoni]CAG0905543.1 unnamed protein product [Darwinula stevensoni]